MEETQRMHGYGGMASIIELTKEIKMDPDNALLYVDRSQCFRVVQQHYHAVKDAEKVISLRPKWFKGYYYKGLAEFGAEHYLSAVESFEDGLQYNSDTDMIKALQKSTRAMFVRKMNDRLWTIKGFFLGLLIGGLALVTNDYILPSPIVKNILLKVFLFAAWGYCGMETAKTYSKTLEKERDQRLEAPKDLFPFSSASSQAENRATASASCGTSTEPVRNGDVGAETRQPRHRVQSQS